MKTELEEAAERSAIEQFEAGNSAYILGFKEGAKWQAEKMYSEEDLQEAFYAHKNSWIDYEGWFEQFKKK